MRERERESAGELIVMDVCPMCSGIWLDRGELEKLTVAETRYYDRRRDDDDDDDDDKRRRESRSDQGQYPPQRKRSSFFGNLLEGFGE